MFQNEVFGRWTERRPFWASCKIRRRLGGPDTAPSKVR
jgi:hypothetical protein